MNSKILATILILAFLLADASVATEPMRVWVDESGRFSLDARLVEINEESIVLLRKSGGTVALDLNKISERDRVYVDEVAEALKSTPNRLRLEPPKLPRIDPLPVLDLPPSGHQIAENAALMLHRSAVRPRLELPGAIAPDAAPTRITFDTKRYALRRLGTHDVVSRLHAVSNDSSRSTGNAAASIAFSVSSGMRLPGQPTRGQIIRFDADSDQPTTVWEGPEAIRMFDHHQPSNRSLVSIGHSSIGHGGKLAIATGWEQIADSPGGKLRVSHYRSLPPSEHVGRLQSIHWARWIDEEHVCVLLDRSLVGWNLISGEQTFRIDGVIAKASPAMSAGRRYIAVPGTGTVDLYRTSDGQSIGRIPVEANSLPAVSFAPRGDALAIVTSRRLRVWDLRAAALRADVHSRRSLGNDEPLWISDDLVMSGSGVLSSLFRGVPIWQYEVTGAMASSVGTHVAVMRKSPSAELSIVSVPHDGALDAIKWIDSSPRRSDTKQWRLPGRSVWTDGRWSDRDVRLSSLGVEYR